MKIDPVTFEVDPSGGLKPLYVWEAPVRIWHWLMAAAMFVMLVTGYLIGRPPVSNLGVKVMSLNLLVENPGDPVVWRGPVIAGAVKQFWSDVYWGDLDVMFVDMPPGTGDVPLTVFQSLPVDGVVIVSSPQELVGLIVEKSVKMVEMMEKKVLGLVENMSYFACPDCGKRHAIFGESHVEEIAKRHNIATACRLPIDPEFAKKVDAGAVEFIACPALQPLADII